MRNFYVMIMGMFFAQSAAGQSLAPQVVFKNTRSFVPDLTLMPVVHIQDTKSFTQYIIQPKTGSCPCAQEPKPGLSFEGLREDQSSVMLEWKATNEPSIDGYLVERAFDYPVHFVQVGYLYPKAGEKNIKKYSLPDQNTFSGTTFYRLTQLQSKAQGNAPADTIAIKGMMPNEVIRLFPNPARSFVQAAINSAASATGRLLVTDAGGAIVYQQSISWQKGFSTIRIPTGSLAAGSYTVSIVGGEVKPLRGRFIKQ